MKGFFKTAILFVCLLLTSHVYSQLNWALKNSEGNTKGVENNGKFLIINKSNGSPLKYGKRSWESRAAGCINIIWGNSAEALGSANFVNVERMPGATGPIKTGEKVALRFEGGGYLNYEKQTVGVNLGWVSSNTKAVPYIWELRTLSNKIGEVLNTNTDFGIYCHANGDWLVYCDRNDPGINLGWSTSCSGCKRSGFDIARDYIPYSTKIIGDVKAKVPDGENLGKWCY